jgi:hypothetical protein
VAVTVEDITRVNTVPVDYESQMTTTIVTITIEDTGCGMSPEFVDRMLSTPFTKADPFKVCLKLLAGPPAMETDVFSRALQSGAGLGDTLACRTVELLGGVISIQSAINRGTFCRIEVPLRLQNDHACSEDGRDEDEVDAFIPPRPVSHPVAVVGFEEASNPGLIRAGKTMRRQIQASGVDVTSNLVDTRLIICEASYDLAEAHPEVLSHRLLDDRQVILLGSAREPLPSGPCSQLMVTLEVAGITTAYFHRPITPLLVERLLMHPEERERQLQEVVAARQSKGGTAARDSAPRQSLGVESEGAALVDQPPADSRTPETPEYRTSASNRGG